MKRLFLLLLCAVLLLTGCTSNPTLEPTIPQVAPETIPTFQPETIPPITSTIPADVAFTEMLSVAVPIFTENFELEDGTELFSYTAQTMQLILPNEHIADRVILHFLNRVDSARKDAEAVLEAAQSDYTPDSDWYPYHYQVIYSPTRIDHSILSLMGTQSSFSGGTHGAQNGISVNYDMTTGDVLTLGSIMHMDATKEQFIEIIIDKLTEQSEELQLFEGFENGVYQRLGGDENLYEDFYFTNTGLGFYFAPYEIAPYSAGMIHVEIPYNELPGLIYDGYFPAEREQVQGKLTSGLFMAMDMTQFNSMAEVTLTPGESIIVVYPEGKVEDIRIIAPGNGKNIPSYTVFAALEMSANNAVLLSVTQEDAELISIEYVTEGNPNSLVFAE